MAVSEAIDLPAPPAGGGGSDDGPGEGGGGGGGGGAGRGGSGDGGGPGARRFPVAAVAAGAVAVVVAVLFFVFAGADPQTNETADTPLLNKPAPNITGDTLDGFTYERKFHVAHVARRNATRYRYSHDALRDLLGERLVLRQPVPTAFTVAMGDEMYLVRDPSEGTLREVIAAIQALPTE